MSKIKEFYINQRVRLNEQIAASTVRLIDENGAQAGVVSLKDALLQAEQAGLDLVEISPNAQPPVVKIVDWGKFQYEKTKQLQKAKRNQKVQEVKQLRFGLKIGQHDVEVKLKKIQGFLEKGNKVKLSIVFRGREITHQELGHKLLHSIVEQLGPNVVIDQTPQLAGRFLSTVIRNK